MAGTSNLQPSKEACASSCRELEDCRFWTWGKSSPLGPCFLKTARENVTPGLAAFVSGSRECWPLGEAERKAEKLAERKAEKQAERQAEMGAQRQAEKQAERQVEKQAERRANMEGWGL